MRNWFRSSSTRFRPCSMKASNLAVNLAMRSRSSSKPKLMLGRLSAMEGPAGGRPLVEWEGSKTDVMVGDARRFECFVFAVWCDSVAIVMGQLVVDGGMVMVVASFEPSGMRLFTSSRWRGFPRHCPTNYGGGRPDWSEQFGD